MPTMSAPVIRIDPSQSSPLSSPIPTFSSSSIAPRTNVAIPIGRLMKKIQCQLTVCVSTPPTSSPREPPPTATKMYALIARARSPGSGNSVTISAMITEEETAPPRPWMKRATISTAWSSANPHSAEAAVKIATPVRNTRLRPMRSPSRPASSRKLPNAIMYALTTQLRSDCEKPRSSWIRGSATLTTEPSSAFISIARHTTTSAIQRRRLTATPGCTASTLIPRPR